MTRSLSIVMLALCALAALTLAGCSKKQARSGPAAAPANAASQRQPGEVAPSDDSARATTTSDTEEVDPAKDGTQPPDQTPPKTPKAGDKPTVPTHEQSGDERTTGEHLTKPASMLPRVVDLGRGTCIPCKRMAPILADLQTELKGKAVVEVIDLRDDPEAAEQYKIRLIPTQIFFDSEGKQIWRHEGFLAKEEIIAKLKEAGMKG